MKRQRQRAEGYEVIPLLAGILSMSLISALQLEAKARGFLWVEVQPCLCCDFISKKTKVVIIWTLLDKQPKER